MKNTKEFGRSVVLALLMGGTTSLLAGSECDESGGSSTAGYPKCADLYRPESCNAEGFPATYCDALVGCGVRTCINSSGEKITSCFGR